MHKRFWAVNVLLAATVAMVAWKLQADWRAYARENGPASVVLRPVTARAVSAPLPVSDYSVIAVQNPFHPDRNDQVAQSAAPQPAGPPPLVYGSVILGNDRYALLATEDMAKPQKIQEGETFAGYRLAQVRPQSIVLSSNAGEQEIMLYNALSRLRREHVRTEAQSGAPSSPPVVSTGAAPARTSAPAPGVASPSQPAAGTSPPGVARPGKRLMPTPFGPIWVDEKRP